VLRTIRHLLVPLTATWLSLHLLVITGTVVVGFASGSSLSDIVCTCAHGADHGSCPMHGSQQDSTRCRLQGTQDDLGTALMAALGPLVLPIPSNITTVDASSPGPIGAVLPLPSDWILPPEPPPPRA
jgi:hypothetical protein